MNLVNELMRCVLGRRNEIPSRVGGHRLIKSISRINAGLSLTRVRKSLRKAYQQTGGWAQRWSGLWLAKADAFTRRECGSNRRTAPRPRFFAEGAAAAANR